MIKKTKIAQALKGSLIRLLLAIVLVFSINSLFAAEQVTTAEVVEVDCLGCHQESQGSSIHAIWQTPHGKVFGKNNETCVTCHGPSLEHGKVPRDNSPSLSFGPKWPSEFNEQSAVCLGCHEKGNQVMWLSGVHNDEQLSCLSCHNIHTQIDEVLVRIEQSETCFTCHKSVQASAHMPSSHPILEGKTTCVDCHNPHGNISEHSLNEPTVNDTCFSCHAEKRGPFLFEHAPVAEDCTTCHKPHGSVNASLLKTRGPFLCQQCHSAAFHPSVQHDGGGLPNTGQGSEFLLGKNCLNCHSQIHGSNHPSGSRLTR
ncbi:DmsE family decaheme c-type cytochrome [Thalassotalea nanhaiensis]|uniref:DmsE family decaheme c-type cytochrome n=1 Tax=Thalassotalea nanhaiensis TaxID=3065648 RepID=A0ABY9TJZ9_9GAMM|nr:DmsE family decaheme c-type cytochrome [Colwelliaceae bacterium SQ345]